MPGLAIGQRPADARRRVVVTALILAMLVAASLALPFSLRHGRGQTSGDGTTSASASAAAGQSGVVTTAARQALLWISQQVSRSVIVACDPQTCSALAARGIPAANLLVLRAAATSPLHAKVIVVTPTVRSQFGTRLSRVLAPSVLAVFGSGADRVTVQATAPDGPAAYDAALLRDVADRKAAGAQLLANNRIKLTAKARTQLANGQVDSRILTLLPALAATYPVQVLAFGDPGPGASPGIPLCSADLSASGKIAGLTDAKYLSWLDGAVRTQVRTFAGSVVVAHQGGRPLERVEFSRPSPLGLLSSGGHAALRVSRRLRMDSGEAVGV